MSYNLQSFTFDKESRLNDAKAYRWVFANPLKIYGEGVTIFIRANQCQRPRLGLAVSKKKFRHAVVRNKIRRYIRESFRQYRQVLPSVDIVVLAKKGAEQLQPGALLEELHQKWIALQKFPVE